MPLPWKLLLPSRQQADRSSPNIQDFAYNAAIEQTNMTEGGGTTGGSATVVKVREIIAILESRGWYLECTRGSHRQYKNPDMPGRVTVPGKPGDELAPGTLNSILKQARIKE